MNDMLETILEIILFIGLKIKIFFTYVFILGCSLFVGALTTNEEIFFGLMSLIIINLCTGIGKTYHNLDENGDKIRLSSKGFSKSGLTVAIYFISLFSAYVIETIIIKTDISVFNTLAAYYGFIQFYSILKNTKQIDLLNSIKELTKSYIQKLSKKDG